jgi:hypothetical protein
MTNDQFIDLLFSNCEPGAAPWVTAFTSAPGDASRGEWAGWAVQRPHNIPRIDRRLANTYCTVSTYRPGPDGRYRRRKANFAAMHAVMIDDIGTKIEESAIALPATVRIETSPGNCQDWLKLDPPITDMALAERLVDRMIAAGLTASGEDPGMKGVTRYGRLPQGVNTKPRPTGPWLHRVVEVREDHAYTADEIAEAYELDTSPPPPPRKVVVADPSRLPDALAWLQALGLYKAPMADGWHDITCPWVDEHTGQIDSGTAYRDPAPENHGFGAFKCHHGHCEHRRVGSLFRFIDAVATEVQQ